MHFNKKRLVLSISLILVITLASLASDGDRVKLYLPGEEVELETGYRSEIFNSGDLIVINFNGEPEVELLDVMKENGIELSSYLGNFTYFAKIRSAESLDLLPLSAIAFKPTASMKINGPVRDAINSRKRAATINATIKFAPGTSIETAKSELSKIGAKLFSQDFYIGNRLDIKVNKYKLKSFATSNNVESVGGLPYAKLKAFNTTAAKISNVDDARTNFNLSGQGVTIAILDGGKTHDNDDFDERVTVVEDTSFSSHATHVMGTVLGAGYSHERSLGMAPSARGYSYDFTDGSSVSNIDSMKSTYGIQAVNNSWGYALGWEYESDVSAWVWYDLVEFHGVYYTRSQTIDEIIHRDDIVITWAAGNDRDDAGPATGEYYKYDYDNDDYELVNDGLNPGPDGTFGTMDSHASAKNIISVGAVDSDAITSDFSNYGPTGDGRIKPDLVTKGEAMISPASAGSFDIKGGTSMACPVVTGSTALLIEQFKKHYGRDPHASEVKAIFINTARDLGRPGPDYAYGWGLLDMQAAAAFVENSVENGQIIYNTIVKKQKKKKDVPDYYKLEIPAGTTKLKVCLVWTVPAGAAITSLSQKGNPVLVNDLNLKVYFSKYKKNRDKYKNKSYNPWVLNPANPDANAVTGVNNLDNVEQVERTNPKKGTWYVEISKGTFGQGSSQAYALVIYTDSKLETPVVQEKNPAAFQ